MTIQQQETCAVFIFNGDQLQLEMLYSEFESVLDRFVPLPEQAGDTVTAVYVVVGRGLFVREAVFFTIDIDSQGYADKRWNLPLNHLAECAAQGPNLGGGAIKLACLSQCPANWQQGQLWDPNMDPRANHFVALKKIVKRNNLRINFPELAEPSTGADIPSEPEVRYQQQLRVRLAQKIKEQRLRIATLQAQHREELKALKRELQQRQQEQSSTLDSLCDVLKEEKEKNKRKSEQLHNQHQKMEAVREYFEHKLSHAKTEDKAAAESLRQHFSAERDAEVAMVAQDLTEKLQRRDIEVMYRDTQIAGLNDEIVRLRQEKAELLNHSGDRLLEQIAKSGISFVTLQRGLAR